MSGTLISARDLDTLLHAARKLVRVVALEASKADLFQQAQRAGLIFLRRYATAFDAEHHVGKHREPRK